MTLVLGYDVYSLNLFGIFLIYYSKPLVIWAEASGALELKPVLYEL